MFDEFVEHAATPPAGASLGARALSAQLQYEGFEPSPYEPDDNRAQLELLEASDSASHIEAVFSLGTVEFPLPAPLVSMVVCSDVIALGLSSNLVVLILMDAARSEQVVQVQIPRKPTEMTLYQIFLDPSGRHLLITSTQGENWYLYRGWKKPRQLKSYKMIIESVAWHRGALLTSLRSTSTREMLIGARNGTIYEAILDAEEDFFKSQERYLQPVFSLPERQPITGISFDFYPSSDPRKALVIATTPSRIYQFVGAPDRRLEEGSKIFAGLFATYRDAAPKILELPGDMQHSELHVYIPNAEQATSLPDTMAWMTGPGVYHGRLNFESATEDLIDGADVLPYPNAVPPISISLTEFHFVLLYKDRVVALSTLDQKLSYEEVLPLKPNEQVRGMTADPLGKMGKTYWVYTDQAIYELGAKNEDRDVWKTYLDKQQYDLSLKYARTAAQRDTVLAAQAFALFDEGRYFQAAQAYAQCSVSFEEVTLKFLDAGERDALRSYLVSRLERTRRTDSTQRMMLATWLIEFYLSKCNELDDIVASESVSQDVENLRTERTILEEDLKQFFETYKTNLDPSTVYELIQGHGRTDMYLHYATVVGDVERVIEHWVLEEEWGKAIDVISRQTDLELYYRFAPVLMHNAPKDTVDAWLRQAALDPLRLVPALLQLQHAPRDPLQPNHALRYLHHVVFEQQHTSPTIHNLVLTFHASALNASSAPEEDGPLLRFLASAPADPLTGKPYYDLDYALRLCKRARRTQPCVHIYAKMGLWENSVDLALEKGDLELAKINADMPEDDRQLRKKLWLKIAKYVVQDKKDIKAAMLFLENTDLLQVEDILPFFPDFVVIDDFKDEICDALEGYAAHIDGLRKEMDEATANATAIKADIAGLQNRFVTLDAGERCAHCKHSLLTRQFYVFPCQHSFHADCLIGLAKEYLPAHALRRILTLQTELVKGAQSAAANKTPAAATPGSIARQPPTSQRTLLSSNFAGALARPLQDPTRAANSLGRGLLSAGDKLRDLIVPDALASVVSNPWVGITGVVSGGAGASRNEARDAAKAEKARVELEEVLAANCPLCEIVVAGLDKPFVKEGEVDTSWDL